MPDIACLEHRISPTSHQSTSSPPEAVVDIFLCILTASLLKPRAFLLLCLRNSFLWHPVWVLLKLCLEQIGNAGDLQPPDKSCFLIHDQANSKAHTKGSLRGRQQHKAPLMHTSLTLTHLTFSTPCANKLSVPKSLSQVLLWGHSNFEKLETGKDKREKETIEKSDVWDRPWNTRVQQVGRWKGLQEHREAKAWRPEGRLESGIFQTCWSTVFAEGRGSRPHQKVILGNSSRFLHAKWVKDEKCSFIAYCVCPKIRPTPKRSPS